MKRDVDLALLFLPAACRDVCIAVFVERKRFRIGLVGRIKFLIELDDV